ncbi:MAG TPA: cbb3-type cytochrome c oxidase subunit 3 [Thiotrichales bacterium]|nr:cbb3-type cytochrome c oxidase subunit 3 [Thiotrichales bacterium]
MEEITATLHAWWTVAMFVLFVGIWIWAWSSRRKDDFREAANLPFADEPELTSAEGRGEKE